MSRSPSSAGPRWLDAGELKTWQWFTLLLNELPHAMGRQLQRDSQLSYLEYYVLAGLSDQADHRMRMCDLAVLVNSEQSRLSHLVGRLEKRGFVRREPDPADGRYMHAILTEAGYSHLREAAPAHVEHVREVVYDALDADELRALRTISEKIVRRLGDRRPLNGE
ncbi:MULTISPECIES: MarR family winged helix-turn-helix transcriptional regulator [Amycolatopsis]|uniref:MarR family transcriptional regulator n=1 Tax=Amycolatopsis dongchuanensis TaxID=1070866 RepID=A0ABP8VRA4_9PSEU